VFSREIISHGSLYERPRIFYCLLGLCPASFLRHLNRSFFFFCINGEVAFSYVYICFLFDALMCLNQVVLGVLCFCHDVILSIYISCTEASV